MAQTDWVFSIESKIYTIVKTRLLNALSTTYPTLFITQQQKLNDDSTNDTHHHRLRRLWRLWLAG